MVEPWRIERRPRPFPCGSSATSKPSQPLIVFAGRVGHLPVNHPLSHRRAQAFRLFACGPRTVLPSAALWAALAFPAFVGSPGGDVDDESAGSHDSEGSARSRPSELLCFLEQVEDVGLPAPCRHLLGADEYDLAALIAAVEATGERFEALSGLEHCGNDAPNKRLRISRARVPSACNTPNMRLRAFARVTGAKANRNSFCQFCNHLQRLAILLS
jgi:hypothetical protein